MQLSALIAVQDQEAVLDVVVDLVDTCDYKRLGHHRSKAFRTRLSRNQIEYHLKIALPLGAVVPNIA